MRDIENARSKLKIVVAEPINEAFDGLIKSAGVSWDVYDSSPNNKQELIERLKDAEVATSFSIKYDAEIFEACPRLKYLSIPAVGANFFVNMDDAKKYGVTVMNTPGYNAQAVAELAIGMAIAVARKIPAQQKGLSNGIWHGKGNTHGFQLSGKNIGIIGNGNIGKKIQDLMSSWSVKISVIDSKSTTEQVDSLFIDNQIIFVCCPLTDSTKEMVSGERINSMSENSIIINVGRGAVIDQEALLKALENRKIYGAGLDVFVNEPEYGADVSSEILDFYVLPNTLITPHVAGNTFESSELLAQMTFENLHSAEAGKLINVYE